MSLLDDARTLFEKLDRGGDGPWAPDWHGRGMHCLACGINLVDDYHAPDCPWRSMPKIIAVLEAAERFVTSSRDEPHDDETAFEALVTTLKGEENVKP